MESIAGGDLFDSLPDQCPGCGEWDTPAESGPSRLMFLWMEQLGSYLCFQCKDNYSKWISTTWAPEVVASTELDLRETNKPKCVKNVEAIAKGWEPDYKPWTSYRNPVGIGYTPPVP